MHWSSVLICQLQALSNTKSIRYLFPMRKNLKNKAKQGRRSFYRVTAVFIILFFILTDLLHYVPSVHANPGFVDDGVSAPSALVPENVGRVEESFQGSSGKTIFFIQDAHDSLEAQENIARVIGKLVKENGVTTVFEEGYEGPVPTDKFFGFIKNSKVKQKVSHFLLDKLRIGGAEYAHINREADFKLVGVENLKLYGQNIRHYQEVSKLRRENNEDLKELLAQISSLADRYFPKNLKVWIRINERFSDGTLPLLNYLKEIQVLYHKGSPKRFVEQFDEKYPAISILLAAENSRDPALIGQLNKMDFKEVFGEIFRLEQGVSAAYLRLERDRLIFNYYQALRLLLKLNQIKLTQPEYEAMSETLNGFKTQELADFVVSLTHRPLVLSKGWERNIKSAVTFYEVAQERDRSIDRHLGGFLHNPEESTAALVFGGFHASAIKEILRAHQISYHIISPRIDSMNERHQGYYKYLMSGGQYSFETPFFLTQASRPPSIYFLAAMLGDDAPIRSGLLTVAFSADALGGNFDSQLTGNHLAELAIGNEPLFSGNEQAVSTIETSINSIIRSETRTKKITVTGASGDLGAALVRYLDAKGNRVSAVVRSEKGKKKYQERALRILPDEGFLLSDLFDQGKMQEAVTQSEVFYHFAALVGLDKDRSSYFENFKVNGLAALGLLKMAEKLNPAMRFIFASTQRVYNIEEDLAAVEWVDAALQISKEYSHLFEESDYSAAMDQLMELILQQHPFPENVYPYELAKLFVERYMERSPLKNYASVRISNVYGPGNLSGRKVQRMIETRLLGHSGKEKKEDRNYIYIQDAVEIIYQLGVAKNLPEKKIIDIASDSKVAAEKVWELIVKHTPEAKGKMVFQGDGSPANEQSSEIGRQLLGRDFTNIETGIRNQIDQIRARLSLDESGLPATGPVLVIDAGGTSTRMAVWDGEALQDPIKFSTPHYDSEEAKGRSIVEMQGIWLNVMNEKIQAYRERHRDLKAISMGFAGPVGEEGDITESAVIWGSENNRISNAELQRQWGLPVKIVNDLTAAIYRYGKDPRFFEARTVALITVSSGIGSKLFDVVHGNVVIDGRGRAGEIGHTIVDYKSNAIEGEGLKGELNAYASGRGLSNLARRLALKTKGKRLYQESALKKAMDVAGQAIETADKDLLTHLIVKSIHDGDEFSLYVMKESISYLVRVLGPFILQNAPDYIVWMGSIVEHLEPFYLDEIINQLLSKGLYGYSRDDLEKMFVMGEKDDENGLRGAGLMVYGSNHTTDKETSYDPGYVRSVVDERGYAAVEAFAPNHTGYKNYFTDGIFDLNNPILADVLGKRNTIFVIEKVIADKFLADIRSYIQQHQIKLNGSIQVVEGGEKIKSMDEVKRLTDYAQDQKLDRNGVFVTIGGGAVMDMVGMVASQFRRGVQYVRVPTTLLGQVDAAVGVKVGIDYRTAKNFLGAFYPPEAAITDIRFLESLPRRHIQGGLAEVIKVALVSNAALFETLEEYGADFLDQMNELEKKNFIRESAIELLRHLQKDFFEHNLMRHVDFGHVLAHKFESMTNYELAHGEAVAIDILLSAYIAHERGMLSHEDFDRIVGLHSKLKLPYSHPALNPGRAWEGLEESKAHKGGRLMMVVPIGIGRTAFIDSLRRDELDSAMQFLQTKSRQAEEIETQYRINENDSPAELKRLSAYLKSFPQDVTYYISEIEESLNTYFMRSLRKIINIATNQVLPEGDRNKAVVMLEQHGLKLDGDGIILAIGETPHFKQIRFIRKNDVYIADEHSTVEKESDIAQQLLNKEAFVFDIDGTLTTKGEVDPEIISHLVHLLKLGKTVAFATVRGLTVEDYFSSIKAGEGLGVLKNIFEHPEFKPSMLEHLYAYTSVGTYKFSFRVMSDHPSRGWVNIEPVNDANFYQRHANEKVFSKEEEEHLELINQALFKIDTEFYSEFEFELMDYDYEGFARSAKIQKDEKSILYFPRTKQTEIENWKLRILKKELETRLQSKLSAEVYAGLSFRVVWKRGIVVVKKKNQKNEAVLDLVSKNLRRSQIVFFGDEMGSDGVDRLVADVSGIQVVSVAAPIRGDVKIAQLESSFDEAGPDRLKRILDSYFDLEPRPFARSEIRFTSEEVADVLNTIQISGEGLDRERINPGSINIFAREANMLGALNPQWVMRSILGKTSQEIVTDEELRLFFYDGAIQPVSILYRPFIRPSDINHSNRLKKGVQSTSSNHPLSPTMAETIAINLANKIQAQMDLMDERSKPEFVLGKYTGGLVIGELVAQILRLPFVTLTKRPYDFILPKNKVPVQIPEPHMPQDNPEYYSNIVLPAGSKVLFIDDEITTGQVVRNTTAALEENLGASIVGVGAVLQSSPDSIKIIKDLEMPFASLDSLTKSELEIAEKDRPTLVPFKQALPLHVPEQVKELDGEAILSLEFFPRKDSSDFFVDHSFRGMTIPLDPTLAQQFGKNAASQLSEVVGDIGALRQEYYDKKRTLFLVGTTPSGILAALPLSQETRLPLIGAMNRPEPKGYGELGISDVVNYINLDGNAYSMFGLTQGDGVILVTGELTDGTEQMRLIKALRDKGVHVHASVSVVENQRYPGRINVGNYLQGPVISAKKYDVEERVDEHNFSSQAWASLKYAIIQLDQKIKKINPEAKVEKIRVLSSSLTRGLVLDGSDLDEMFVFVDGVSQFELSRMQGEFQEWLNHGNFKLVGQSVEVPILLSNFDLNANIIKYNLKELPPSVTIYRDGKFIEPDELQSRFENDHSYLAPKHVARIKWFLSVGEMNVDFARAIARNNVQNTPFLSKEINEFISGFPGSALSPQALEWVKFLDQEYRSKKKEVLISGEKVGGFKAALIELANKGMIRIFDGKLILVWRHNSVRFSDQFWNNQITVVGHQKLLEEVESHWRLMHPDYQELKRDQEQFSKSPFTRAVSPYLIEFYLRSLDPQLKLNEMQKQRLLESFGSNNAFVLAAGLEIAKKRGKELRVWAEVEILNLLDQSSKASLRQSSAYFGSVNTRLHLLLNLYLGWMQSFDHEANSAMDWFLSEVLENKRFEKIPSVTRRGLIYYLSVAYKSINDRDLQSRIVDQVTKEAFNLDYFIRMVAKKALERMRPEADNKGSVYAYDFPELSDAEKKQERAMLYAEFENRRKAGHPIQNLVSDWDGTLISSIGGDGKIREDMSALMNWLTNMGKNIVITTAASYARLHAQSLDGKKNMIPLNVSDRLQMFTDTVGYLNDRPVSHRLFPNKFMQQLSRLMDEYGWSELNDGRPPRVQFFKEGISYEQASFEAGEIKSKLPEGIFFHLTLSPFRHENKWIVKIYYATKGFVLDAPLGSGNKIVAEESFFMGDDAGEFGIDAPMFEKAGERALKINVGNDVFVHGVNLKSRNEKGSLLALEAWVASSIQDESEKGSRPVSDVFSDFSNQMFRETRLSETARNQIVSNVRELLFGGRSESRTNLKYLLTEEDIREIYSLFEAKNQRELDEKVKSLEYQNRYQSVNVELAGGSNAFKVGTVMIKLPSELKYGSHVLIAFPDNSLGATGYYPKAFGNVSLLLVPETAIHREQVRVFDGGFTDSSVLLDKNTILKVVESLDLGQQLNLSELNYVLDLNWNEASANPFERELAWLKKDRRNAPLGELLTDNRLFQVDSDGNIYLIHMTLGKKSILDSHHKQMHVSPLAMGAVVHSSPILRDRKKPLQQGGRVASIVREHWKNIQHRRAVSTKEEERGNYFIAFKVPYLGSESNRTSNWISYLGFGRAYLDAAKEAQEDLRLTAEIDFELVKQDVVSQYAQAKKWLSVLALQTHSGSEQEWEQFWEVFVQAREVMPILNQVFFEIVKNYIILYQDDRESLRLFQQSGDSNQENYYKVIFEASPSLQSRFDIDHFRPGFDSLNQALQKYISGYDQQSFKEFLLRRFSTFIGAKLLEGAPLPEKVNSFDDLVIQAPNLAGLLNFNVTYSRYLRNNLDLQTNYKQLLANVLRRVYEERNITVPIMGIVVPTGEAGVWQREQVSIQALDVSFDGDVDKGMDRVSFHGALDIRISPDTITAPSQRALSHQPSLAEASGHESNRSEMRVAEPVKNKPIGENIERRKTQRDQSKKIIQSSGETGAVYRKHADQIVRNIRNSSQAAMVFLDAEDFPNLSAAQKREYFFMVLSNKALRVIVYNDHGQIQDKQLEELLKLDRVERTNKDIDQAVMVFSRANLPAIHLSKNILPSHILLDGLSKKVAFFKVSGSKSGTLAAALLWAISGGEKTHFQGVKEEKGFWVVEETLLDQLQRNYENNFVFAQAA